MQTKRGDLLCALFLAVLVGHLALTNGLARWWSLGIQDCATSFTDCTDCDETELFDSHQEALCLVHGQSELVRAMAKGILEIIRSCQREFTGTKWNCTTFRGNHLFGSFVENATRETAILNAFLSAGAVHGIASACHENIIDGCPCEPIVSERIDGITYLRDCGDNVQFAISLLRDFYGLNNSTEERALVDKWNNKLGYEACNNRSTYCRCTGLSGSCIVQTCYEKAPAIPDIGSKLQPKYQGSQKVEGSKGDLHVESNGREPIEGFPVYINDTPDLCSPSQDRGILGTSGRKCNPLSSGSDGCNSLCCNGFHEIRYNVTQEDCRFVWCCRIECIPIGIVEITEYLCD